MPGASQRRSLCSRHLAAKPFALPESRGFRRSPPRALREETASIHRSGGVFPQFDLPPSPAARSSAAESAETPVAPKARPKRPPGRMGTPEFQTPPDGNLSIY